jgi:hypothetical protein
MDEKTLRERLAKIWLADLMEILERGFYVLGGTERILSEDDDFSVSNLRKIVDQWGIPMPTDDFMLLFERTEIFPMSQDAHDAMYDLLLDYYHALDEAAKTGPAEPVLSIPEPAAPDIRDLLQTTTYSDVEIARMVGRSRQHVNKIRQELREEGVLR